MTIEELEKTIKEVNENIESLPEPDKRETWKEARHRRVLLLKKETLEKIKEAKAKEQINDEIYLGMVYALLTTWGEKHPYLMELVKSNLRWGVI